jgi:hypothetical protein
MHARDAAPRRSSSDCIEAPAPLLLLPPAWRVSHLLLLLHLLWCHW